MANYYGWDKYDEKEKERLDNLPKRNANKDFIEITDIGGITHYSYNVVRYKDYVFDDDVDSPYVDAHGAVIAPKAGTTPETHIKINKNGKQILLSIYELALEINSDECKDPVKSIIKWCKDNFHPYDIDLLYSKYKKDLQDGEDREEEPNLWHDGAFEVKRFMRDINNIYQAFTFVMAITELEKGNPEPAYNLYKEGKYFDTFSFFEGYKWSNWEKHSNKELQPVDKSVDIVEEMMKANEEEAEPKLVTKKKFLANALKDKENLYEILCGIFPDIDMHLKYDHKNKKVLITASINSVFDICWYSIARLITYYGADDDRKTGRLYKEKDWYYDEGTYATCLWCGKHFIKKSNRQLYCENEECQKAHNRLKQRNFKARKKLEESLKRK